MTKKSEYEKSIAQTLRDILTKTKNQGNKIHIGKKEALPENVTPMPGIDNIQNMRLTEALLFAAQNPLSKQDIAHQLPKNANIDGIIKQLQENYANKGINLVQVAGKFCFRTAEDLAFILRKDTIRKKKLSKSMRETLAIIAYHQPVTRAEIEEIRGVSFAKGNLDTLMQIGWIRIAGRRKAIGKPITYATHDKFLIDFGLNSIKDLPDLEDLREMGLLNDMIPTDMNTVEQEFEFQSPKPQSPTPQSPEPQSPEPQESQSNDRENKEKM